ncbi:MAG TPA: response regulator, partial [Albitalea sp.]|nr:response regulator [Albitalea sp.]
TNAVKFTDSGEIVVVTVKAVVTQAQRVTLRFSVRDTGVGISPEQVQTLFRPFSQLDASTTRKHGGTGLGLAICRQLVELMGGEITVKSQLGKGSDFQFTAQFGLGRMPAPEFMPAPDLRELRILAVDDSANSLEIFQDLLGGLGYRPTLTSSAAAAIAELERAAAAWQPYDLVLLDWKMPELDGFEAVERIVRIFGPERAPKIIMVTAYGDDDVVRRASEAHLAGCLAKPVSASTLMDAITRAMTPPAAPARQRGRLGVDPATLARLQGVRVLLAEDNEMNRLVVIGLLQDVAGAIVTVAHNGQEAVELARTQPFDLVLMDVQMPEMDGYDAARLIRQHASAEALPIIAMTAHAMRADRDKCLSVGMNDHVAKPFDPDRMFTLLSKWLRAGAAAGDEPGPSAATGGAGVSFERGLERCLNQPELYERALRTFIDTESGTRAAIRAALASADSAAAAARAHSTVSSAGAIGADALATAARALQRALESGESSRWPALLDEFEQQFEVVMADLARHLGALTSAAAP